MVLNAQSQDHRDRYREAGHGEAIEHVLSQFQNSVEDERHLGLQGLLLQ